MPDTVPPPEPIDPYRSARDLPSFRRAQEQLTGLKRLGPLIPRAQRPVLRDAERRMNELVDSVDRFYELLGTRNWILHDRLNFEDGVKGLLDLPVDEAEQALIAQYRDREQLGLMLMPLNRFDGLRARANQIERARRHYQADRFDAVALTLIPVMDGFINDLEPENRRGLHAREARELGAWDSVVGHHMGLSRAHRTFTKTFRRLSGEPVYELYRNGIVHGALTDYDNIIVATKAWNRLFAVVDWATAREKQAVPTEPAPSMRAVARQVLDTAAMRRETEDFRSSTLSPEQPDFATSEHLTRSTEFLSFWQAGNYGRVAQFIGGGLRELPEGRRAGRVRDALELFPLNGFEVTKIRWIAPAVCDVDVTVTLNGEERRARLRWIREGEDGKVGPSRSDDRWLLYVWEPMGAIGYREQCEE